MSATYIGIVEEGQGRALKLGFPTVNIAAPNLGLSGVYAARVVCGETTYSAAAFADPQRKIVEAHLIDFSGDLYGKKVSIEIVEKIRDTKGFENDEELREMISADVEKTRAILRGWKPARS